jgi:hypothetical protein
MLVLLTSFSSAPSLSSSSPASKTSATKSSRIDIATLAPVKSEPVSGAKRHGSSTSLAVNIPMDLTEQPQDRSHQFSLDLASSHGLFWLDWAMNLYEKEPKETKKKPVVGNRVKAPCFDRSWYMA